MDVWDPNDKITVFSQIKKAINTPVSGFKRWSGMILPGILTVFYFFIFFLVLSGCAYLQRDKIDDEIIITDLPPLEMSQSKKIACIKLLPECND
jgi:hypothetical protein